MDFCLQQVTETILQHPQRNVITRALGVEESVRIDFCQEVFNDDDIVLLCSDGLSNYASPSDIVEQTSGDCYFEYAQKLVDLALKNGGGDNVTVVAVAE